VGKSERKKSSQLPAASSSVSFGFQYFAATVKTARTDMVWAMDLASGAFNPSGGSLEGKVAAVLATFRRGFFILLDGHGMTPKYFWVSTCQTRNGAVLR
jgi:hypothetical protein